MKINFKNTFYFSILFLIILLIIYNWNFLSNSYNYKIYEENCIINTINENNYKTQIFREEAEKFCDCKVKKFKKEKIKIFVSKLSVEKKFFEKEQIINKYCKKNLKF